MLVDILSAIGIAILFLMAFVFIVELFPTVSAMLGIAGLVCFLLYCIFCVLYSLGFLKAILFIALVGLAVMLLKKSEDYLGKNQIYDFEDLWDFLMKKRERI